MNGWAAPCARKQGDTAEQQALGHLHTAGRTLWAFITQVNRRCWAVSLSRGSLRLDRSVLHAAQDGGCVTVNLSAHARRVVRPCPLWASYGDLVRLQHMSTASTACNNASMCEPVTQSTHELGRKSAPECLD